MKMQIYLKSTFTDIRKAFGRFISIILMIMIGVLLFVGIKSIGPNLENTAENYLKESQLSDLQIVSTAALTEVDQKMVENLEGAKVELGHSFPVIEEKKQLILQIYSFNDTQNQNQLNLITGSLPTLNTEVVMDASLSNQYKIGDKLTLENELLTETEFEIVGFVESMLYIDNHERGVTTIGHGQVDGFVYIPELAFDTEAYSIMFVTFDSLREVPPFSESYNQELASWIGNLEELFDTRKHERKAEIQARGFEELAEPEQTLIESKEELEEAQRQLDMARVQLVAQEEQLALQKSQLGGDTSNQQLSNAEAQLAEAMVQLEEQQKELDENRVLLDEAITEIQEARIEIENLATPNYFINDRSSNPGFSGYTSLSESIDAMANVFPVFFFFIAILITFTTMTRMIEENRKEIGTLKALGYRKIEIASKYILYALLAAFIGTTIGVIIGSKYLPTVVFSMLGEQYIFNDFTTDFFTVPIGISVLVTLIATLGSSMWVLMRDLQEKTTALLMPKAPKAGKRVLLERITPLWSRMNFNQKVTYRNLFRYKIRMVLTILGIAGCTGLMLAGFGLQDSLNAPAGIQFNEIMEYQAIVTLGDDMDAREDITIAQLLTDDEKITDLLPIYSEQITIREKGIPNQTATVYLTDSATRLQEFVTFNPITKDSDTELDANGAIISQRLSKIYNVQVGDPLTIQDSDGSEYAITITGIVENYLGHHIYMTEDYFKTVTGIEVPLNTYLLKLEAMTITQENALSESLLDTDQVLNTTFMSSQIAKQEAAMANVGSVVLIFIILSGTLAFVVLYNLTNINISERERELATIKVLGFFNQEVTMYIVRENVIFTLFGILFGFAIGRALTWFILAMSSTDLITFPLVIEWQGYAISALMTCVFSAIVMFVTHIKLKNIKMIEALKSNE